MKGVSFLLAATRLALRNLFRRKVLTLFMFLSLMVMTMGFLLIVSVSERIALEVWSFEGSMLVSTGHVAGCPYWCDAVMVPEEGEYFIPDSVKSEVMSVQGVEWIEPMIGVIPNNDLFSGDWRIRKPNGTVLTPIGAMPLIEGGNPQLELLRIRLQLSYINGRFLEEGEKGVVVVGETLASVFEIGVNDTIVIPGTMKSMFGIFSIKRDAELRVVGIYCTRTDYDKKMLTTIEEAEDLYGLQDQLTCILVKYLPDANSTTMMHELNGIPNVEVFVPIEKKETEVKWGGWLAPPRRVSRLSPTRVVEVAYGQVFLITIFVTGAFIASSTSSKLYERRHEIGLLKSVGFKASFIQLEVVIETLIIGFAAGVTGFAAANSVALLSQSLTIGWLPSFPLKMGTSWFVLVLVLSCGVSTVSSYIPALRSSRSPPMEAMRRI